MKCAAIERKIGGQSKWRNNGNNVMYTRLPSQQRCGGGRGVTDLAEVIRSQSPGKATHEKLKRVILLHGETKRSARGLVDTNTRRSQDQLTTSKAHASEKELKVKTAAERLTANAGGTRDIVYSGN